MAFVFPKYESDILGLTIRAKLSEAEAAVAGTPPTADTDAGLTVYSSGSKRRHGVFPRGVICSRTAGTAPNNKTFRKFVTILTPTALNGLSEGGTLTIGGVEWTIRKKVAETVN